MPISRALFRQFPHSGDTFVTITVDNGGAVRVVERPKSYDDILGIWDAWLPNRVRTVHNNFVFMVKPETAKEYWLAFPATSNERMFTLQFKRRTK